MHTTSAPALNNEIDVIGEGFQSALEHSLNELLVSWLGSVPVGQQFYFNDPLLIREKISALEEVLMSGLFPTVQLKTSHTFAGGLYIRKIFIPKGMTMIGKLHKKPNFSMMTEGSMITVNEKYGQIVEAPFANLSQSGMKRILCTLEDSVWTSIHAVSSNNLKDVEEELIAKSFDEIEDIPFISHETLEGF